MKNEARVFELASQTSVKIFSRIISEEYVIRRRAQ